jgi:dimethylargininase
MSRSGSAEAPYRFNRAIVRTPARSVVDGLRANDRGSPAYDAVTAEHGAYVAALKATGVAVIALPPLETFPDSMFVEDPALAFSEGAILLRPGAPSRAGEVQEIAPTLREMFETVIALPTGFADGGDVLVTPGKVLIGLSERTNRAGAEALSVCLAEFGREAEIVETPDEVLHFKTACSLLDEETIFCTPRLAESGVFEGFKLLVTPDGEEAAANALRVNDVLLIGSAFPRTIELLESAGYKIVLVPTSEVGKIDAGLSCMSLRWLAD